MAKPISTGEGAVTGYLTDIDPPAYSYNEMLERAVDLLHQHNPEYSEKRRYNLKPPQLMKGRSRGNKGSSNGSRGSRGSSNSSSSGSSSGGSSSGSSISSSNSSRGRVHQ
jgi:uncharacterized membrane protein YgcG